MTASNSLPITLRLTNWGNALTNTLLKDRRIYTDIEFSDGETKMAFSEHLKIPSLNGAHFAV